MSQLSDRLTKKWAKSTYEQAKAQAETLTRQNADPNLKEACDEALAHHPGNPANPKPVAKPGKPTRAPAAKPEHDGVVYETQDQILEALADGTFGEGEEGVGVASKLLSQLKQAALGTLYCRVSQKGAISLYGMQRMPITLYAGQWERLAGMTAKDYAGMNGDAPKGPIFSTVLAFIAENEGKEVEVDESVDGNKTGRKVLVSINRKE